MDGSFDGELLNDQMVNARWCSWQIKTWCLAETPDFQTFIGCQRAPVFQLEGHLELDPGIMLDLWNPFLCSMFDFLQFSQTRIWLVVWNHGIYWNFISPYIGNNHPN